MSTTNQTNITADLIEKELITVKLISVDVVYKQVDSTVYDEIYEKLEYNETPTKLTASKFQTAYAYRTTKLKVYLNGVKIHNSEITEDSSTTFSFDNYNTDSIDLVEVSYIKA